MYKRISVLYLIISFSLFSEDVVYDTNKYNNEYDKKYNYEKFISIVENSLSEIKINSYTEANAYHDLLLAKSISDVNFYLDAGAIGMQKSFGGYSFLPETSLEANGAKVGFGVSSIIPYSGTRIKLELTHNSYFGDLNVSPSALDMLAGGNMSTNNFKYYEPKINIQIVQPLLRDFLGKLDKYQIKDAEYQFTIAKLKKQIDDKSVLSAYETIYYQWVMGEKFLEYYKEIISDAKYFESQIYKRLQNKLIDNDTYQNSKRQTLKYENAYYKYELNLKEVMRNINFFIDEENIKPDDESWSKALDIAINRDLKINDFENTIQGEIAAEFIIRAKYALSVMKNNAMPDLSLIGNVSLSSFDDSGYFRSFSSMTNLDYFVGLRFSYPIGGREYKAKINKATEYLNISDNEYQKLKRDYGIRMGQLKDNFETYKKNLVNKKEELEALNSKLKTQDLKFNQGLVSVEDIIATKLDIVVVHTEILNLEYALIVSLINYNAMSI